MARLLAVSEWANYTVTLEERDGEFCGAIAENANGDRIFVIAMKNDNGKFELSVTKQGANLYVNRELRNELLL